ncbi:MAG TPA: hypothetical protein DD670_13875 [Planctomycetaceae bacterium]|nr:hypothetical protein [Planctomycetaceae bacterium]
MLPEEQFFVYLLNRVRHDPVTYQIEQGVPVDLSYVTPRPPLAVNDSLFASAGFHADEMATYNYFAHRSPVTGHWPNKMARDKGYALPASWSSDANYIESLAAGRPGAVATLYDLIVDEGYSSPLHRNHLLGIGDFSAADREIGVGHACNAASKYKDYWAIHATRCDPAGQFLTGVVYQDKNGNHQYNLSEGLGGVTVSANGLTTTTNSEGGWSIRVTNGTYRVSASGGTFSGTGTVPVNVSGDNVEVDFLSGLDTGYVDFSLWVNKAPTIDATQIPTLSAIAMNTTDPPGSPVAGIVGTSITDPDLAALRGIAVMGVTGTANGVWQ